MGELKIKLPDKLEYLFRKLAMKRFGYQKGSMSEAAKEAISKWANSEEKEFGEEDLWDSLQGILSHVKKTSVQLQHEASDYRAERYDKHLKKK